MAKKEAQGTTGKAPVEQAAQNPAGERPQNQQDKPADEKKIGEAEPGPGEDNNKRLAFLEERALRLYATAAGVAAALDPDHVLSPLNAEEHPVDASLRVIREIVDTAAEDKAQLRTYRERDARLLEALGFAHYERVLAAKLETYRARDDRLLDALKAEGFEPEADEPAHDAAIRLIAGLRGQLAEHGKRMAELGADPETGAAAAQARKDYGKAVKNVVELFEDLPDTAAITLRFAAGGEFARSIAPIELSRAELAAEGSKAVLQRRIEFQPDLPPTRLTEAVLIAGRKTLICEISGGLRVGGGAVAAIPKGHLAF